MQTKKALPEKQSFLLLCFLAVWGSFSINVNLFYKYFFIAGSQTMFRIRIWSDRPLR